MSLFDGRGMGGPMPTNLAEMGRGVGQSISRGLLNPYMESKGYVSQENQILEIMKGADLTDAKSVSDTFNKIMMINPEAAGEFQKQVMPMLAANETQNKNLLASKKEPELSNLGKYYDDAERILSSVDPNFDINTPEGLAAAEEFVNDFKKPETAISRGLGEGAANALWEGKDKATKSRNSIIAIDNAIAQIEKGIISGSFSGTRQDISNLLYSAGLIEDKSIINTQKFIADTGNLVLNILGSGDLGAGTGLSDNDVRFALTVAGSNTDIQAEALLQILKTNRIASQEVIKRHNKLVSGFDPKDLQSSGVGGIDFTVNAPDLPIQVQTRDASIYKNSINGGQFFSDDEGNIVYPDGTPYTK
jgi:hypothetical protein